MGTTWVVSAPAGSHVGPMNLGIRVYLSMNAANTSVPYTCHAYRIILHKNAAARIKVNKSTEIQICEYNYTTTSVFLVDENEMSRKSVKLFGLRLSNIIYRQFKRSTIASCCPTIVRYKKARTLCTFPELQVGSKHLLEHGSRVCYRIITM